MLQDANARVRRVALEALINIGEAAPHADTIAAMLQDPDAGVQKAALEALGSIGEAAAPHADAVVAMLQDANADMRASALVTLSRIGEVAANADTIAAAMLQDASADVQVAALEALCSIGEAAAPHAETMLLRPCTETQQQHNRNGEHAPNVQLAAARVLSKLGCLKTGHHATLLQLQFKLKSRKDKREVGTILRQVQVFCRSGCWTFRGLNPHVSNLSQASLGVALDSLKQLGRHRELSSHHVETVLARCADGVELDELILVLNNCQQTAAICPHLQRLKDRTAISSTWVGTKAAQNLASSALSMLDRRCLKWRTRTHVFAMIWKQCLIEFPEGIVFLIPNAMS